MYAAALTRPSARTVPVCRCLLAACSCCHRSCCRADATRAPCATPGLPPTTAALGLAATCALTPLAWPSLLGLFPATAACLGLAAVAPGQGLVFTFGCCFVIGVLDAGVLPEAPVCKAACCCMPLVTLTGEATPAAPAETLSAVLLACL